MVLAVRQAVRGGCLLSCPDPCLLSPSISLHHLARNLRRSTLNTGAYRPQDKTKEKANRGRGTKVRRNMVTNGGPVTVTGNGATVTEPPLPGRATLSGNRRGSCYRSREQSSVTVPKNKLRRALRGTMMRFAFIPVNLLDLDSPGQVASAHSFALPIHFWTVTLSNIARDRR